MLFVVYIITKINCLYKPTQFLEFMLMELVYAYFKWRMPPSQNKYFLFLNDFISFD